MIDTEIILQSVEKHQKVKNLTVLIIRKSPRFFSKKIIPTKFQKETLATEVLIGKVYKEIVLTSVAKSIIKSTVSR